MPEHHDPEEQPWFRRELQPRGRSLGRGGGEGWLLISLSTRRTTVKPEETYRALQSLYPGLQKDQLLLSNKYENNSIYQSISSKAWFIPSLHVVKIGSNII